MDSNPAYGVSNSVEDRQISTGDNQYELVDLPATDKTITDERFTGAAQEELKNKSSCKVHLVFGIALSTAVLALVVAVVSVGLSTTLNSKLEIQSLTTVVNDLQLSLNQSAKTIEYLGQQISALQTDTATQYGILNKTSTNNIEDLGQQISAVQTDTATQYGILNITVNGIQNTIREQSDLLNNFNSKGSIINPATSCSEIPTDRLSGEYWILVNSSSVQVYCDMNRTCCNTTGGWMRVANLDMTDSNQQCPDGFLLHNETTVPLRTCGRPGPGCVSTTFPVHGIEYSHVCGKVIGYQFGVPEAFSNFFESSISNINDVYVDGVSLTHGQSPRKHIWTFACALNEVQTNGRVICPCTRPDITYTGVVPPFIGQDYFCDTGSGNSYQYIFYRHDPLWNGQGCGGTSICCSFNNPPWFCKQLPQPTTDDIELRLCANAIISDEDIFLQLVDIFVQ